MNEKHKLDGEWGKSRKVKLKKLGRERGGKLREENGEETRNLLPDR